MLRNTKGDRSLKENVMLAAYTAFVAGVINVAGVIAFFAFSSNITGHVANLAKHIVSLDLNDITTLVLWLLAFFLGAFLSSYIIKSHKKGSPYRTHSVPIMIEMMILFAVALYSDLFYRGGPVESEVIIGCILFSMGLQNSVVSIISGGLVKSAHLTGLMTDMGAETAEYLHPKTNDRVVIKHKLYVRCAVFFFHILGGLVGAYFFYLYKFEVFYAVPLILLVIIYYDLFPLWVHRFQHRFKRTSH